MRYFFVTAFFITLFTIDPIYAGQNEYDDCLLKYLINAKVDVATKIITGACKENYYDFKVLSEKRKNYNECLLEYLPGMESNDAVIEIQNVCARKYL